MPQTIQNIIKKYVSEIQKIYGEHLRKVILYGSYAGGDFRDDSDIDIMILLDLSDLKIKNYRYQLSEVTYDFNYCYGTDIKPIAKSEEHFMKWVENYPFYANINKEGVALYGVPNSDTIAAIKERDMMLSHLDQYKRYSSFSDFMKEEENV